MNSRISITPQSVEKAIKACLALRNIVSGEHKVTIFFEEEFENDFDSEVFAEILRNARELEVQGIKTRYPFFHVPIFQCGSHRRSIQKRMQKKR